MTVPSMPSNTHSPDQCAGQPCCIHNPSDHHMRDWPMVWRDNRYLMERTCEHGIGHPDPDHMAYVLTFPGRVGERESGVHGCDGCCTPDREPYGADDRRAEELHAIALELEAVHRETVADTSLSALVLGDRKGELLVACKCDHPYHETTCTHPGCGCRYWRARGFDATYTRGQEYQMDAYGDYDHRPEEE